MATAKRAPSPEEQLATFMDRYAPPIAAIARAALEKLRAQIPGATEFVYDNFNALVIGFGPSERPSEAVISIALYPRWVNLYFIDGASLPDPAKRLKGAGSRVRRIIVNEPGILDEPAVRMLIKEALRLADTPFKRTNPRRLVVRAVALRQRSRRPRGSGEI
jgi:hypothetical protein